MSCPVSEPVHSAPSVQRKARRVYTMLSGEEGQMNKRDRPIVLRYTFSP